MREAPSSSSLQTARNLKSICLSRYADLICKACRSLETVYGSYHKPSCVSATVKLKSYLTKKLGRLINGILPEIEERWWTLNDSRLMHTLLLQKWLTVFIFEKRRMMDKTGFIHTDKIFWNKQFSQLCNVVELDMRYITCTDETLKVVCDNCCWIEVIRFQSGSSRVKTMGEFKSEKVHGTITNVGLAQLHRLDSLRVVDDSSDFSKHSLEFLKRFFAILLRRLENFTHKDILNLVLDNYAGVSPLRITHLKLHSAKREHLMTLFRLCGKVTHLHLKDELYDEIFKDLRSSTLPISSLHVEHFTPECALSFICDFLRYKGSQLKVLILESPHTFLRITEIFLIGKYCPNLEYLELVLPISYTFHTNRPGLLGDNLFHSLKSFTILENSAANPYYKKVVEYFRKLAPVTSEIQSVYSDRTKQFLNLKYCTGAKNTLIYSL